MNDMAVAMNNFDYKKLYINANKNSTTSNNQSSKNLKFKKIDSKDIFLLAASSSIGAVAEGIAKKKEHSKMTDAMSKAANLVLDRIEEFNNSPHRFVQNIDERAQKNGYKSMSMWIDKFWLLKEEPNLEKPNGLMFIGQDKDKTKRIIDWFAKTTEQEYVQLDDLTKSGTDLIDVLEEAEKNFNKTGKWNLIYADNLDNLINPSVVKQRTISGMKAIMSAANERYHSTFLIHTKDWRKLDDIAIESNRISAFYDVDNMKDLDTYMSLYNNYSHKNNILKFLRRTYKKDILKSIEKGVLFGAILGGVMIIIKKIIEARKVKHENRLSNK